MLFDAYERNDRGGIEWVDLNKVKRLLTLNNFFSFAGPGQIQNAKMVKRLTQSKTKRIMFQFSSKVIFLKLSNSQRSLKNKRLGYTNVKYS